jgi:prepilin-type N-terminal cleavage/methylation domain-containing protein
MKIQPISGRTRRGFTLIELMVAMAITTLIVTILVSITAISLDTWTRNRSEVRAARQAKSMADTMAKDLEALVTRRGTNIEWISATTEDVKSDGNQPNIASPNAADVIFYSAPTDRYDGDLSAKTSVGDVSCVGYQLKYQDPIKSQGGSKLPTFVFYRLLVNPDETFEKLLTKSSTTSGAGVSTASGLKDIFDSAFSSEMDKNENFVCENIFQYTITLNVLVTKSASTGSAAAPVNVPITLGNSGSTAKKFSLIGSSIETDYTPTSSNVSADELKNGILTSVEVSLTVLTDFGVDQMRKRSFGSKSDQAEFLAKNSYQYSKLVQVPSP